MNLDGVEVFKFLDTQLLQAIESNQISDSKSYCEVLMIIFKMLIIYLPSIQ